MPTITSERDAEALTLTFVSHFPSPVERVWQVWEDPRQLERWWGPPTYPATFERHEFAPGGRSLYYMTSPEGEKMWGWWAITLVDAPRRLEFDDGFANPDGTRDDTVPPTHTTVTLEPDGEGSRMTSFTQFISTEQLETMVQMGMEEGMTQAMGQIEAILAE